MDCRIGCDPSPLLVPFLTDDGKVRDATIAIHQFDKRGIRFRSLANFEDQELINRNVPARFSNVCENQFPSLKAVRERITRFLDESIRR